MMSLSQIRSYLKEIKNDTAFFEEKNFDRRADAIEFLEFHVIGSIEASQPGEWSLLIQRAQKVKAELGQVDDRLFENIRANIRAGKCSGNEFKDLVNEYFNLNSIASGEPGYDNLDLFINRLFPSDTIPKQTEVLEPEMVFYQKTPARVVFELAEKCHFTKDDVFFDVGSGLGQVAMLLHLLTGVKATGIEFEPSFCNYARDCASELNLQGVRFINIDARMADYSAGTIFFLYTPFTGKMLHDVLELLRNESRQREIRVITYGPCTPLVVLQTWLRPDSPNNNIYRLAFFSSI